MGFNKKVLSKAVSELGKAKAPGKPKDIITDPAGQWKYPGQKTRIPGNDITMQDVSYPVWAQPNVGPGSMMQPNQDYNFPGASYVDETPMAKKGGSLTKAQTGKETEVYQTMPEVTVTAKRKPYNFKKNFYPKGNPGYHNYGPQSAQAFDFGFNMKATPGKDSNGENLFEIIDPTGISSWDDIYRSAQETGWRSPETGIEIFGAIPLLGKAKVLGKGTKDLGKTFATTARQKNNVKAVSNTLNALGKFGPTLGRGTDAMQAYKEFKSGGSKLGTINLNPNPLSHYELNYGFNLPAKENGGEADYEDLELTDEEIQAYRDGGYIIEELPQAQDGGPQNTAGPRAEYVATNPDDYEYEPMPEEKAKIMNTIVQNAGKGNIAARRMMNPNAKSYTFTGNEYDEQMQRPVGVPAGEKGSHFSASMGNFFVPFIQEGENGNLQFNEYANPSDKEAIKFNTEEEANFFANHYKKANPPMMQGWEKKQGGYVQHEIAKAQGGKTVYSGPNLGLVGPSTPKNTGSPLLPKQDLIKKYQQEVDKAKAVKIAEAERVRQKAIAKQKAINDAIPRGPVSDNTRTVIPKQVVSDINNAAFYNSPQETANREARKKEQAAFEKEQWNKYNKMSFSEKALDVTQAALAHGILMAGNALTGNQAYIPGMGRGLMDKESPEYDKYLKATGQTKGQFEISDLANIVNPGYWGAHAGNELHKGNYATGLLETGLAFAGVPGSGRTAIQGAKSFAQDINQGAKYLNQGTKAIGKKLPGSPNALFSSTEKAGITGNRNLSGVQNVYVPKSTIENPTAKALEENLEMLSRTGYKSKPIDMSIKGKLTNFIKSSIIAPLDEGFVMPLRYNSSIKKAKKYFDEQKEYFKIPEVRAKLIEYGVDPDELQKINFQFGNTGSGAYGNKIQFDPKEMKKIQKLGLMLDERTIMAHELGHSLGFNADKTNKVFLPNKTIKDLPINKELYQEVIKNKYGYGSPAHQLEYFTERINKEMPESYAHLREMKQNMINTGIIKRLDEPVTEKQLTEFFSHNYKTGKDRVSNFVDKTDPKLIKFLSKELSNARILVPTIGTGVLGAGALQQEKNGGATEFWEDDLTDDEINALETAGYTIEKIK